MNWLQQKTLGLFVKTNGQLSDKLLGGLGCIFMLHRVLPDTENVYTINRDLAITPQCLEEVIVYLREKKYAFISLDELNDILRQQKKIRQRFVCFTLDDGYRDNLEYGLPVFQKYNVPITIYVTNSFPNGTAFLWWYLLEEKVNQNPFISWENAKYTCNSENQKQETYNIFRNKIKSCSLEELTNYRLNFFNKTDDELQTEVNKISLSWDEVRQMARHPLVTIASHTINHLSLKNQQKENAINEMVASKLELEKQLNKSVEHFAYPYGGTDDVSQREYTLANDLKFKTAVLNQPGNIFYDHKTSLMALPRYPLGNKISKDKMKEYLNGISHFSNNQFTKTINY